MELWIARDKSGVLNLFNDKPEISPYGHNYFCCAGGVFYEGEYITIDRTLFPQVTWENSPQRVRIELMEEGK